MGDRKYKGRFWTPLKTMNVLPCMVSTLFGIPATSLSMPQGHDTRFLNNSFIIITKLKLDTLGKIQIWVLSLMFLISLQIYRYTSKSTYWTISLFLLAAAASCILEVYMSRIRAKLCNIFYPDRAEERADFLYFKIISG